MLPRLTFILSLAIYGSPLTIREKLPNGLYKLYYNEIGEEVYDLITDDITNLTSSLPSRSKRKNAEKLQDESNARSDHCVFCGCGFNMDRGDTDAANAGLAGWAASSPRLDGHMGEFMVSNSAIAFVCNYGGQAVTIPSNIVGDEARAVTYACGLYVAGTARIYGYERLDFGYMNHAPGHDICGDVELSDAQDCDGSDKCCQCHKDCRTNCENGWTGIGESLCLVSCVHACCHCPNMD